MEAFCKADRLVKKCRDDPKLPERRDLLALFIQAARELLTRSSCSAGMCFSSSWAHDVHEPRSTRSRADEELALAVTGEVQHGLREADGVALDHRWERHHGLPIAPW